MGKMKTKAFIGFCILFILVAWNVNAVAIPDQKLEIALRKALDTASVSCPEDSGSWLPPIQHGSIADTALSYPLFNVSLDISKLGITKLDGLEFATNLTGLNASGNNISSLSYTSSGIAKNVLGGLANATFVNLSNNKITSLLYTNSATVLEKLNDTCTELDLSKNRIAKLSYGSPKASVFKTLTALRILNLNNNMIASPTELSYIGLSTTLKELYLSYNRIAGALPNMSSLVLLEKLQLNGNLITNFSKLEPEAFTKLVYLDISNNAIPSISVKRINPVLSGGRLTVQFDVTSAMNLYGISFKLHFKSDANVTASGGSATGSVLGTILTSSFNYPGTVTEGDIGIAISKQGRTTVVTNSKLANAVANGKLATVNLKLNPAATFVKLTFADVYAVTNTGASITFAISPLAFWVIAAPITDFITVFPGDANNNGKVDAGDLITIASCFGYKGTITAGVYDTARPNDIKTPASSTYRTTWFPQIAPIGMNGFGLWRDANGVLLGSGSAVAARADCDGDGIVGERDALVVAMNLGKLTNNYTSPAAPLRQSGTVYSLHVLDELLDCVKSMPESEAREKMISVLKNAIEQTQKAFIPKETVVLQNYPNPFNPETWLPFQLVKDADVSVRIFDANGKMIRLLELGHKMAGSYLTKDLAAYWDGKTMAGEQVSSGVYFYNIQAGNYSATRKMVVNK
jgi:Leucine-rich repeat (LRR) protein